MSQCQAPDCEAPRSNRAKYCSDLCRKRVWQRKVATPTKHLPRRCPQCGTSFTPRRVDAQYCAPGCASNARYARDGSAARARARSQRAADPVAVADYLRTYQNRNRDRLREYQRSYYASHSDNLRARSREWALANPERRAVHHANRKALIRASTVIPIDAAAILAKLTYWGGLCWMCGEPATQIDHVKPISRGGPHVLANLRPACAPCNRRKSDRWDGASGLSAFSAT